jgi:exodeoxyribonuclease VII small subunit
MKKTRHDTSSEPLTYDAAYQELQDITEALQQGQIGIDDLTTKIERANLLVRFCREKLRNTETALQQMNVDED